jgi:hypothetical protein
MIACILFGLDELLILLFCSLFGLCKVCIRKHRQKGKKACHDHCTDCGKEISPDETWRCSSGKDECDRDRCFDCHDEHVNEAMRRSNPTT